MEAMLIDGANGPSVVSPTALIYLLVRLSTLEVQCLLGILAVSGHFTTLRFVVVTAPL